MSWTKLNESTRALLYSVTCLSIAAIALWFGVNPNTTSAKSDKNENVAPAATFPGANTGAIADRPTTGCGDPVGPARDVTFTVTGLSGAPSLVTVNATMTHSWVADVGATLIAPNGTSHVLFARTGATTPTSCGDSSDLAGTYNFTDAAAGVNWWQAAATAGAAVAVPVGDYRTTQSGPQATANTSPVTNLTAAFAGVTSPNGTWTLRLTDAGGGDTGSISAANLTIEAGTPRPVRNDFDGDGKTDYSVVRNTAALAGSDQRNTASDLSTERGSRFKNNTPSENLGTPGTTLTWFNRNSGNGATSGAALGNSTTTDLVVPADYDGDTKADIAVWRAFAATGPGGASFFILNSSNNTVTEVDFGVTNDNPTIVGDYDGDGKADPAVYRCSFPTTNGQCFYYYKGTNNNPNGNITFVPWGNNAAADLFPNRGDFDGDGKLDFCIQRPRPGAATQGQFVLLRSSDGGVEYVDWDTSSASIVPGDYDGDGKNDFMTARAIGGVIRWSLLTRTGAQSYTDWGTTNIAGTSEFLAQGDYDGDGKVDIGVYRRNSSNPDACFYYIRRSSDGALQAFEWGSTTDVPTNGWDVN